MKWLIPILALGLSACATPKQFPTVDTGEVRRAIAVTQSSIETAKKQAGSVKQTIESIKAREKDPELVLELSKAAEQVDTLTQTLLSASQSAESAATKLTEADAKITKLAQNAQKAETERAKAVDRYHRLKLPLCLLGAAVAGFFLWKFKAFFLGLGPWGIAGAAAAPVGVFGLLWLVL